METDQETLADLSIFNREGAYSVFEFLNYTRTQGGKIRLEELFKNPHQKVKDIQNTQETLAYIQAHISKWPVEITNGTVMMIDKFLEATDENIPLNTGPLAGLNSLYYRFVMKESYALVQFSIDHIYTFLKGMRRLTGFLEEEKLPHLLKQRLQQAAVLLERNDLQQFLKVREQGSLSARRMIRFGYFFRYRHSHTLSKLMNIYYELDAWYSMAFAVKKLHLSFPEFVAEDSPVLEMKQLYHPLLERPVAYDVSLDRQTNFLFLTGANMSGKSTFIKAVGLSVYLAHLGMGLPAEKAKLSLFDGLLSNIQVQDNIFQGESFFFNEVQRIKKTILKINDGRRWLILIDEMFKGTNFQDAQQCSIKVIKGLIKMKDSLFILSTHLYEIAETLKTYPNITFRYFETAVEEEEPQYSYKMKEGISNDRLGFLILKREKVLHLLDEL